MLWINVILFIMFCNLESGINSTEPVLGQEIDSFNGVEVYYNGNMRNVFGRNLTEDGYNLGLLYQCVEYVKRYYYEVYDHRMPNSYGHAKEFFDKSLEDGGYNEERALFQFQNGSISKPQIGDILILDANEQNPFGHAGIIVRTFKDYIVIIQQNVGKESRLSIPLIDHKGLTYLSDPDILGWLRKDF